MMEFAVSELNKAGYNEIIIWVLEENMRAMRFYEKAGFAQDVASKILEIDGKEHTIIRYVLNCG